MKKFNITKVPIVLQLETPHYQFDNHIKHSTKKNKFTKYEILNMIHINQALERNLQMTLSNMKSNNEHFHIPQLKGLKQMRRISLPSLIDQH